MWFVIDSCNDVELYDSESKARAAANNAIDFERDNCGDTGWSEDVNNIMWGKVIGRCVLEFERPRTDDDVNVPSTFDTVCDYHLVDVDQPTKRSLPNAVKQTTPTNCFRACVATVLNIPIDDVPEACDGDKWDWEYFQDWLSTRNLQAIEMTFLNGGTMYPVRKPVLCIATGPSPRTPGVQHAVVAEFIGLEGFRLLHDPHPEELWIDGQPTHATFFVNI